jgi:hypothetical protein
MVLVAHTCNPSYSGCRRIVVQSPGNKSETLPTFKKKKIQKRTGRVAQAEFLPSKSEDLSSNPSTTKNLKTNKQKQKTGEILRTTTKTPKVLRAVPFEENQQHRKKDFNKKQRLLS